MSRPAKSNGKSRGSSRGASARGGNSRPPAKTSFALSADADEAAPRKSARGAKTRPTGSGGGAAARKPAKRNGGGDADDFFVGGAPGDNDSADSYDDVGLGAALSDSDDDAAAPGGRRRGAARRRLEEDSKAAAAQRDATVLADETPDEARLRIAKQVLTQYKSEVSAADEQAEDGEEGETRDPLLRRLEMDAMQAAGRYRTQIAHLLARPAAAATADGEYVEPAESVRRHRGHALPLTCIALSHDDTTVFSGGKDATIMRWDVETGVRTPFALRGVRGGPKGHDGAVLALALSSDGNLLASGGADTLVHLWDVRSGKHVDAFDGHKEAVTGLAFRLGTHTLFSGSNDRLIKLWDCDQRAYMETLFGHQSPICALDAHVRERAVSSATDKTARYWKVVEESQLLFKDYHTASIDCIRMISDDSFLTGSQDGAIAVWNIARKRPTCKVVNAHGLSPLTGLPNWISAVAVVPRSDLVASGSSDGVVRVWRHEHNRLELLRALPVPGIVNGLALASDGRFVVAGVAQEHRLGRWEVLPKIHSAIHIAKLHDAERAAPVVRPLYE